MHPDLERLSRADDLDRQRKKATATLEAEEAALRAARMAVAAREQALAAVRAQQAAVREEEHALNRKLHLYRQRRTSAMRVLEGGGGDAAAAERQLGQCDEILDDTETAVLELMEQQDALQVRVAEATAALAEARADLEQVEAALPARLGELREVHAALTAEREQVLGGLDAQTRDRYEMLLARKGSAVATIEGGACSKCRRHVQAQHLTDLKRGLIVPCHGCSRWLVP